MKSFTLLCLLLWGIQASYATHLLGGYIQAKPVTASSLTYEITVVIYLNESAAADNMTNLLLCFGDGLTRTVTRQTRLLIANKQISLNSFRTIYTYSGPGTYTVSTTLVNRTPSQNVPNSAAQQEPLTLTTTFLTNNTPNETPTLAIPEAGFQIATNQRVVLPLKATDADGDSLVYGLAKPLTSSTNEPCTHRQVANYQFPNDLTRQGTFKLNRQTGDLTWDAPTQQGYFSVAMIVYEYRKGILISQTSEEIPLIVVDKPGTPGIIPPYEPATEGAIVTAIPEYHDETIVLSVFPNPVEDRLQVVIQTSNSSTAAIQLFDENGRQLHQLTFSRLSRHHEQLIGMGSLSPGVYLLRADVDGRTITRKILKK
jgi:hypothetical protein